MTNTSFPFPPKPKGPQVDPALLTSAEYAQVANKHGKMHPDTAFDVTVAQLNRYSTDIKTYPKLLRNLTVRGIRFQVRVHFEEARYPKFDADMRILEIDGVSQYYTDEEMAQLGLPPFVWMLGMFDLDSGQRVATVQDEWGCLLVMVASEYRGFGFGPLLTKIARTIEPNRASGGFTPSGFRNFSKVHASFVRDALASGLYSKLVKAGALTTERAREIVNSVTTPRGAASAAKRPSLNHSDPKDWLLYVGEYGDFVLYDRKLRELLADDPERDDYFVERMVLGLVYVGGDKRLRLMQFGGIDDKVRTFLMCCATEYCRREGESFYAEMNEPQFVQPQYASVGAETMTAGFRACLVTPTGKAFDYDPMGAVERRFRASFDRYGEFKDRVVEIAYAKFRYEAAMSEGVIGTRAAGLAESVATDVAMRAKCLPAYHALTDYISKHPAGDFDVDIGGEDFLAYRGERIGFEGAEAVDVLVLIGKQRPHTIGISGSFSKFEQAVAGGYTKALIFYCLQAIDPKEVVRATHSTKFLSLFQHEFMHLLDDQRTSGGIFRTKADSTSRSTYMNDPAEFNARFHDVAAKLTAILQDADTQQDTADLAEIYGFTGAFWEDLKSMTSGLHENDFVKWLRDDRRKAFLRRIYRLHAAVVEALGNERPVPVRA